MRYREYGASPLLASILHCVWTLEGHAREFAELQQPVLPDGRPEIILHLGDPFDRIEPRAHQRQPATIFAGQLVGPLTLRPTGSVAVVGVRLQPHGAAALFDQPQDDLIGLTIGLDDLSPRLAYALNDARDRTSSVRDAAHAVQRCLEKRVDRDRIDARVRASVEQIVTSRGPVSVDRVASSVGFTPRHLERLFKRTVGISPKRLARITRFQRALRVFERLDSPQRGTDTAAMCGYADQAHFIRDFRELAGCPPGAHLMRQAELNAFFSANVEPGTWNPFISSPDSDRRPDSRS